MGLRPGGSGPAQAGRANVGAVTYGMLKAVLTPLLRFFYRIRVEGIVEGRIRDGDPEVLTNAVLGVTNQLARVFIHERGERGADVADAAVAFCLEGLLAVPPAATR